MSGFPGRSAAVESFGFYVAGTVVGELCPEIEFGQRVVAVLDWSGTGREVFDYAYSH